MNNLTEEKAAQLAMSPLYVLFLVASAYVAPARLTERQIVRAVEYGLTWQSPFSEGIFELLRSHLHEFYAELSGDCRPEVSENLRVELLSVKQMLEQIPVPSWMVEDFKQALKHLAGFVAAGGAFRKQLHDPGMRSRAAWIAELMT